LVHDSFRSAATAQGDNGSPSGLRLDWSNTKILESWKNECLATTVQARNLRVVELA
jgi:hypothetical protein